MALVLCTGVDAALEKTRQLLLEKAGHVVVGVLDERSLLAACRRHSFQVAVIGQGASPRAKLRILNLIRKNCPSAKVLELYQPHTGRNLQGADSWLEVPAEDPQRLAESVAALAGEKTASSL